MTAPKPERRFHIKRFSDESRCLCGYNRNRPIPKPAFSLCHYGTMTDFPSEGFCKKCREIAIKEILKTRDWCQKVLEGTV